MGNEQPKKVGRASKTQIDVAALKARIHLQIMRDRKNAEILKGQKQLVGKIKNKSRNRTEQLLIAQRVVNSLKYAGACNMLIAYANSLKGQSSFLAENIGNKERLQPWLPMIYSMLYAADHLGLSSLNQFKTAMRAMNDPIAIGNYVNDDIRQLLTASPTPEELNMYMVEMSERNDIRLEEINMVGHCFTKDFKELSSANSSQFNSMEYKIAEELGKGFTNSNGQGGFNNGGQGGFNNGGQGGFNNGGQGGGQGLNYQQGNQGFDNRQGFNNQGFHPMQYQQPHQFPLQMKNTRQDQTGINNKINPYEGLSSINHGPGFYEPSKVNPRQTQHGNPRQFADFNDIIDPKSDNNIEPMYPSVNFSQLGNVPSYSPTKPNEYHNHNNSLEEAPQRPQQTSPTISQILRDFEAK